MFKMLKPTRFALLLLLAFAALRTPAADAGSVMKHEKYQLPNGLTVILHEDHKLPQVVVNIWYHVGTREEPRGRSGFAHLFEHLMFMGTKRVPDNQFDVIMETGGGWNNASTSYDRTNYYDVAPASLLPTLLWMEADRMETLGDAMTQKKLDLQREVVRNERREGYDNAPYGPAEIKISELMYPVDHPYHFDVIGSHEDLQAATVQDVKDFFATYYVPNNATLVVAGDFQTAVVKPLIEGLFASIPRGAEPPRRSTPEAKFERVERHTITDKVQLPKVIMTWHSPDFYRTGDVEMDMIASTLAQGKSSRLYQRLVKQEQLAVDVSAYQYSRRLGSMFRIEVMAKPDAALDRIETVVDEELERFRKEGPTEEELKRGVAEVEASTLKRMESLREVADMLNHYDAYLGEPDSLEWDLARYGKVTRASMQAQAVQWLLPDARLVVRIIPTQAVTGPVTRESRPQDFERAAYQPPTPYAFELSNGLQVWHLDRPGLPLFAATLLLPGGAGVLSLEEAGLASLSGDMLMEGAGDLDAAAFSDALNLLGASMGVSVASDATQVSLTGLTRNASGTLDLLVSALQTPRLSEASFTHRKGLHLEQLRQVVDHAPELAARVAAEVYYGAGDADAYPVDGYPRTVAALTREQVRAYHDAFHGPAGAILLLAGDLRDAEAKALIEKHFSAWKQTRPRSPRTYGTREHTGPLPVYIVDRPDAAQTVVRFVFPGVAFTSSERVGLEVLNTLFGGSFTSRLNSNLREKHGFTYGASSRFVTGPTRGTFVVGANVQTQVTGRSLEEFFAEFERVRAGTIVEGEATKARSSEQASAVQAFGTLGGSVGSFAPYARNHLPATRLSTDMAAARAVTVEQLNALAKARVAAPGGILLLVGDAAQIKAQLAGLPLGTPVVVSGADALEGALLK
jgi:zinc protease